MNRVSTSEIRHNTFVETTEIMDKFKNKYRIPTNRWQNWDYGSNSAYYITICTHKRVYYFGDIRQKIMQLSEMGSIAHQCWINIPNHFPFVELDSFVIMPNHVHGIIIINKSEKQNVIQFGPPVETQNFASLQSSIQHTGNKFGPQSQNLASIIRGFKTGVTKYATMHHICFTWQSRFHDRVIRDYQEYISVKDYINNNPAEWEEDSLFVD